MQLLRINVFQNVAESRQLRRKCIVQISASDLFDAFGMIDSGAVQHSGNAANLGPDVSEYSGRFIRITDVRNKISEGNTRVGKTTQVLAQLLILRRVGTANKSQLAS